VSVEIAAIFREDRAGQRAKPRQISANQISKRSCIPDVERLRRSPSVPRGEPQWRHLMGVEEGAFSAHSKLMPKPSQTLQIISNLGRVAGICMAVLNVSQKWSLFEQGGQAEYDA